MELSLTCFGSARRPLQKLLDEARELGFRGVHPVPGELAEDLPSDDWSGAFRFLPTSILEQAEDQAKRAEISAERIASWLQQLRSAQVQRVVIEPGLLSWSQLRERGTKLLEQLRAEGTEAVCSEASESLRTEVDLQAERELEQFARFLHDLMRQAPWLLVALAVEDHPASLLSAERFSLLREEANLPQLGYWHDTGRAETRAQLGFGAPGEWLDRHASILVGSTLQDWAAGQDQRLPGEGQVDFRLVGEYLPRDAARVLSVAPVYPTGLLPAARDALAAAGLS